MLTDRRLHPWLSKIFPTLGIPNGYHFEMRKHVPATPTSKQDTVIGYASLEQLVETISEVLGSNFVDHWKGKYISEAALNAAHAESIDGDYAIVDLGDGSTARLYIWDAEEGWKDSGQLKIGTTTDELVEGSINKFFTVTRVLDTILADLSLLTATPITNSDTVQTAIGKLQAQVTARMVTAVYDTDADGVVDMAEAISFIGRNSTGATIPKLSVVNMSGTTGGRPLLALSIASDRDSVANGVGVTTSAILNNTDGYVVTNGTLHNLDTSMFADGDKLWLSPTVAGGLTATRPVAPNHSVFIGYVARAHATQGRIVFRIMAGDHLDELHDVLLTGIATNDFLVQDSSGLWKNKNPAAARAALGLCVSTSLSSVSGVVTIDCAAQTDHYVLNLTENVTSWVFNNLPPAGSYRPITIRVIQHASAAKTIVSPASAGETALGPWEFTTVLSAKETIVLHVWHDGTVSLYPTGTKA